MINLLQVIIEQCGFINGISLVTLLSSLSLVSLFSIVVK